MSRRNRILFWGKRRRTSFIRTSKECTFGHQAWMPLSQTAVLIIWRILNNSPKNNRKNGIVIHDQSLEKYHMHDVHRPCSDDARPVGASWHIWRAEDADKLRAFLMVCTNRPWFSSNGSVTISILLHSFHLCAYAALASSASRFSEAQ